ncbi:hypothetical protein D3C72_755070 [compost metagenome]
MLLRLGLRKRCLLCGIRTLLRHHGGDFHRLAVFRLFGRCLGRLKRDRLSVFGRILLFVLGELLLFNRFLRLIGAGDFHLLGPEIGIEGIAIGFAAACARRRAGIGSAALALGADIGLLPHLLGNFSQHGIGIFEKVRFREI